MRVPFHQTHSAILWLLVPMVPLVQWLLPKALQEQLVVHEQLLPPIRSGGELFSWKALWEGGGNALGSITELQIVNGLWGVRFAPAPVLDWDLSYLLCLNELNKQPMLNLSGNIFLFLCAFDFSSKFIWLSCSYVHLLSDINEDTVIALVGSDYLLKWKSVCYF